MKKILSVAAVALFIAGSSAFACGGGGCSQKADAKKAASCEAKKASGECTKTAKSECTKAEKSECSADSTKSGCTKK